MLGESAWRGAPAAKRTCSSQTQLRCAEEPKKQAGRTPILTSQGGSSKAQVATKQAMARSRGAGAVFSYEASSLPDSAYRA